MTLWMHIIGRRNRKSEYIPGILFAMPSIGVGQEKERLNVNFAFRIAVYQLIGFRLRLLAPERQSCIRKTSARSGSSLR
jgi:hypothetical protein